jgi:hypothetical protein
VWHEIRAEERRKQFSEHEIIGFAAGVHFDLMRLCLSTAAINGPNVRDTDTESPKNLEKKPVPVTFFLPQVPHGLIRVRTRACAVEGRRLMASAMARPNEGRWLAWFKAATWKERDEEMIRERKTPCIL